MKVFALLFLAATAAAFDGSGTFTTDGELSAHLDGTALAGAAPGSPTLGVCDAAVVTSKAELDALASCHTIRGHLVIEGTSDITNVNVLSNLKEIDVSAGGSQYGGCTYGLIIRANTALKQIDGLRSLTRVASGAVLIEGNTKLRSTLGLGEQLSHIEKSDSCGEVLVVRENAELVDLGSSWDFFDGVAKGSLTIEDNAILANIRGFHTVQEVSGGVKVCGNNKLEELAGLDKLTMIGSANTGEGLTICNNLGLIDTSAVKGTVHIAGALSVTNNAAVQALSGFETIMHVGQNGNHTSVAIKNNGQLETVSLGATTVIGSIEIENNPNLAVLDMSGVTTIGSNNKGQSVVVLKNNNLKDLAGLRGLQGALTGALVLSGNNNLISLNGLQQVLSAGRDNSGVSLAITDNSALQTTAGLAMSGTLEGAVHIMRNPNLKVLAGLQAVSEIGSDLQGTALRVYMNNVLENLVGFKGLTGDLAGAVHIEGNAALKDLEGFQNVNSATALTISDNPDMISLHGLENVRALSGSDAVTGQSLSILHNENLQSVEALQELVMVSGGIDVEGNEKLENVAALVKGLQSAASITIHNVMCMSTADTQAINQAASADVDIDQATSISACTHQGTGKTTLHVNKVGTEWGNSANTEVGALAEGHICGGTTSAARSLWKTWDIASTGSNGLFMEVDTTKCKFDSNVRTRYLTAVSGESAHWQLVGVNSVYSASPTQFRLNLWHPTLRGRYLLYFAARYRWSVNWLADTSKRSGNTKAGSTGWKAVPNTKNVIYVDVNTQKSGYVHPQDAAPRYVTAIHGGQNHWKVQGAHAVYNPTSFGFRLFLVYPKEITPKYAEDNEWIVVWGGSYDDRVSGISDNTWLSYRGTALEQEVHTTLGYFTEVPTLVTSISGRSHHWMVTGAGAIYDAKAQSFKVYLDKAKSAAFAKEHDWRVNYIAYSTPVDCVVQGWDEVSYGECSATCGPLGRKTKTRKVVTKAYFGGTCNDELELAVACNTDPCPIDCAWQAWSNWGSCSVTCAEGKRTRTRTHAPNACPNGEHKCHGGKECEGNADDSLPCNDGPCPIDCEMEVWSSWGSCSVTCGAAGRRTRTRGIKVSPQHNGASCPGLSETGPCLQADENDWWTQDCPEACTLSAWGDWGNFINGDVWSKQCSTGTCGAGTWSHRREILQQPYYGANNEYNLAKWKSQLNLDCESQTPGTCANGWCSESAPCNVNNPCPIDCEQSAWVPLDEEDAVCTKTCGGGKRYQHRTVTIEAQHGGAQCGASTRETDCNTHKCPVDCAQSAWSSWISGQGFSTCDSGTCAAGGVCDRACRDTDGDDVKGRKTKTRSITTASSLCPQGAAYCYGGAPCGDTFLYADCNTHACPIDCEYHAWGSNDVFEVDADGWRACSKTCGPGTKTRKRTIKTHSKYGGKSCQDLHGDDTETAECNEGACAVKCEMNSWEGWGDCSLSCRDTRGANVAGVRTNTRTVRTQSQNGLGWTDTHDCDGVDAEGKPLYPRTKTEPCNNHECPIDCVVSGWTSWGANGGSATCTAPCNSANGGRGGIVGGGVQTRSRSIVVHPLYNGKQCTQANDMHQWEEQACNVNKKCPIDCVLATQWTDTSQCTLQCIDTLGDNVAGTKTQEKVIEVHPNDVPGALPCGTRTRTISCNNFPCPIDCVMSAWDYPNWDAPCSKTCGGGRKTRTRSIMQDGKHGGVACPDVSEHTEEAACNPTPCPIDCVLSAWGTASDGSALDGAGADGWHACSHACRHDGTTSPTRTRHRQVVKFGNAQGLSCAEVAPKASSPETYLVEQENCNENNYCPIDCIPGNWGHWGSCSKSCCERGPAWFPKDDTNCGRKTRTRSRLREAKHGGLDCPANGMQLSHDVSCDIAVCPRDCQVGCDPSKGTCIDGWHPWGSCTKSCRDTLGANVAGTRTRSRDITRPPSHDHFQCATQTDVEPCNNHECQIPCVLGDWGAWEACTLHSSCPVGSVRRQRPVTTQPQYGADESCLSQLTQTKKWTLVPQYQTDCANLKAFVQEGQWSACDKNCKSGHQYRYVVRAMCSDQAVLKVHMKFRQGRLCNVQTACPAGKPEFVTPQPSIPALAASSIFDASLDEELSWKTLGTEEARFHGLGSGHWQVQV